MGSKPFPYKGQPVELAPRHRRELEKSGISSETAGKAGLRSESKPEQIAELLGWETGHNVHLGNCLVFRYRNRDGRLNGYCRLKPDNPRKDQHGKQIKYEAPKGKPARAYFPPGTVAALGARRKPLLITEGEKKALRADQEGFPCIGISGVYSWCKKRERDVKGRPYGQKELIDDLAGIPLKAAL